MILGSVSALAIVAVLSLLVAINRTKCCMHQYGRSYGDGREKKGPKKTKKGKIGYDIPVESKPMMSCAIWQQEENDIAEEVKKIYHNISNCSKPVLFDMDIGISPQNDCKDHLYDMEKKKISGEKDLIVYGSKVKKPVLKLDPNVGVNGTTSNKQGRSSYQRQVDAFMLKNHSTGIRAQEVFMEEARRSQVQDWVDNSVGTLNLIGNEGGRKSKEVLHEASRCYAQLEPDEGRICKRTPEKENEIFAENSPKNEEIHNLEFEKNANSELKASEMEAVKEVKGLKSCLKKNGKWKESTVEKGFEEIKECRKTSYANRGEENFNNKSLKYTENEDFKTARDLKNLIVTRWIDHSVAQNKLRITEEESDTTLAEKSANEIEYEDIDSILTSVSRMDEERLSKLKTSKFYKELLKRKIDKYRAAGEKIDEVSVVGKEAKRGAEEELENRRRQNKGNINVESNQLLKDVKNHPTEEGEKKDTANRSGRESLSESSNFDQASSHRENVEKVAKLLEIVPQEEAPSGSDFSNNEDDIILKYSIVRNFSDRLKPTIYVSLQHICGLGRTFGYDNTAIARLYFANDGEEYEESEPMKCLDDIYQEQMFSVVGTSTKAIIKDFLVIEIILEDNDEPELYVKLPLEGLRHKATLIDSVVFKHGRFMEEI